MRLFGEEMMASGMRPVTMWVEGNGQIGVKHGGWLDLEGKGQENSRRPKEASQFWLSPWVDDDAIYCKNSKGNGG